MAARRERDRRRPPTERRYNFAPATPTDADSDVESAALNGTNGAALAVETADTPARPATKPISDYSTEYAYVARDLRRVGIVFGSLLLALILLYFILAH
jgi:hypothetical protein